MQQRRGNGSGDRGKNHGSGTLEVQAPGRSGSPQPHFIFITAVDDFAVRTFDVDALD
jgi:hypothetical protein